MANDGALSYRWQGVHGRRGEEEHVAVLIALELFADVLRDGGVGGVGETVDFYGTWGVVARRDGVGGGTVV